VGAGFLAFALLLPVGYFIAESERTGLLVVAMAVLVAVGLAAILLGREVTWMVGATKRR
jgi:hypothetical protein